MARQWLRHWIASSRKRGVEQMAPLSPHIHKQKLTSVSTRAGRRASAMDGGAASTIRFGFFDGLALGAFLSVRILRDRCRTGLDVRWGECECAKGGRSCGARARKRARARCFCRPLSARFARLNTAAERRRACHLTPLLTRLRRTQGDAHPHTKKHGAVTKTRPMQPHRQHLPWAARRRRARPGSPPGRAGRPAAATCSRPPRPRPRPRPPRAHPRHARPSPFTPDHPHPRRGRVPCRPDPHLGRGLGL